MGEVNLLTEGRRAVGEVVSRVTAGVRTPSSSFSPNPRAIAPVTSANVDLARNQDFQQLEDFISKYRPQDLERFREFALDPAHHSQGDGINNEELVVILREFAQISRMTPTSGEAAACLADPAKRAELIIAAIRDFDDRNGDLSQGILETCGAASTLVGILASDQARYASFLRRLVEDGHDEQLGFTLPAGTAQALGTKGMSLSSHLTQIAFMHMATGTYDPTTDKSTRSWMAGYDNQRVKEPGLFSAELQRVLNAYYSDPGQPRATKLTDNFAPENQDSVREAITQALQENRTIIFSARGLPTSGVEPGFHYINVIGSHVETDPKTGEEKTMIVFKDTRGPKYPIDLERTDGGVEVADRARNTYKVEVGEFLNKYANFMLEVKSARMTQGANDPDLATLDNPSSWWEVQNRGTVLAQYEIDTFVPTQFEYSSAQKGNTASGVSAVRGASLEESGDDYFKRNEEMLIAAKRRGKKPNSAPEGGETTKGASGVS